MPEITIRLEDAQRQVVMGLLSGLNARAILTRTGWVLELGGLSFSELESLARAAQQLRR